jgi:hypothetical protein
VIRDWVPSFLDEMGKVAAATLNKSEKRRQVLQFGALGALSGPVVGSAVNMIQKGSPVPTGAKSIPRWLLGSMLSGAVFGGAVPVIRHSLERNIQREANARLYKQKLRNERKLSGGIK